MQLEYFYYDDGYYAGSGPYTGLASKNSTMVAPPQEKEGYVHRWTGEAWEYEEDHRGEQGYVHGQPLTITDCGPYPQGWSLTPPPPTDEELAAQHREDIMAKLNAIDRESVRPLRAIAYGEAVAADLSKVALLEAQAEQLRQELAALPS